MSIIFFFFKDSFSFIDFFNVDSSTLYFSSSTRKSETSDCFWASSFLPSVDFCFSSSHSSSDFFNSLFCDLNFSSRFSENTLWLFLRQLISFLISLFSRSFFLIWSSSDSISISRSLHNFKFSKDTFSTSEIFCSNSLFLSLASCNSDMQDSSELVTFKQSDFFDSNSVSISLMRWSRLRTISFKSLMVVWLLLKLSLTSLLFIFIADISSISCSIFWSRCIMPWPNWSDADAFLLSNSVLWTYEWTFSVNSLTFSSRNNTSLFKPLIFWSRKEISWFNCCISFFNESICKERSAFFLLWNSFSSECDVINDSNCSFNDDTMTSDSLFFILSADNSTSLFLLVFSISFKLFISSCNFSFSCFNFLTWICKALITFFTFSFCTA